jgi:hypothetical protein
LNIYVFYQSIKLLLVKNRLLSHERHILVSALSILIAILVNQLFESNLGYGFGFINYLYFVFLSLASSIIEKYNT